MSRFVHHQKNNSTSTPQTPDITQENLNDFLSYLSIWLFSRFHFFFAKEVRKSTKLIKQASTKGYIRLSVILFFFHIIHSFTHTHKYLSFTLRFFDSTYPVYYEFAYTFFSVHFFSTQSCHIDVYIYIYIIMFPHRSKAQPRNSIISK